MKFSSFSPFVLGLLTFCIASQFAFASLILNIEGIRGTTDATWSATGSVTVTQATGALSNQTVGAAPNGGLWDTGFDNNLGDAILSSASNDLNVALGGGGISYRVNSVQFALIETVDFNATSTPGGDDIQPDPIGNVDYPALNIGDILSWFGSGTLSLSTNFEQYFVDGSYSSSIDGGSYTVNISSIPEPATFVYFLFALVGVVFLRFRARRRLSGVSA